MDKNNEQSDMMQTFGALMGELMINDLKPAKPMEHKKITASTVVIETPFDDKDDIDLVMAAEFWERIIKHFLVDGDSIRLGCTSGEYKFIDDLKSEIVVMNEHEKEGIKYIEGPLSKKMNSILLNDAITGEGRIKWSEVCIISEKSEKVILKKYGNECTVNDLTEEDIEFINGVTSDYFALSYF